ncbi:MAG TPA: alpha/beta fold hydrolase [Prolixibacteraceae bacterium]|mgnify:CR=1 FL=1|nr:alpha/beta fold hydrolase [Prolixibacteraceae bacterium]HPR86105.1 alpha/beta fold hydrolase [Prolixibacteraceae bacterium]
MNLFYREEGEGFPFVIVHGLYGSSDNWLTVGKKLASKYKVFMIDQRNHGRSPNSEDHNYELMKNDLAEFFDQQGIERAILMGHSMGGKTAMSFAADYPERIEKLIVVDIAPKDYFLLNDESQYYLHNNILRAMIEIDFEKMESRKEVETFLNERIDSQPVVQFLLKSVTRNKTTEQFEWRLNVPVLYENLDEIISGVNAHWFDDRLPIKNYPVLFIKGANSNYILHEDFQSIKRIYPEAEITEIPNAGHWLHAEQPQLFMEVLSNFLKKK